MSSSPNHYPISFPHDDTHYLEALVRDYLELMGEALEDATDTPTHTLLMEYKNEHPAQNQNTDDTVGSDT